MVAKEDTKERSRLSVFAQRLCDIRCVYEVHPDAFVPPPKVFGTFVTLTPREKPLFEGIHFFLSWRTPGSSFCCPLGLAAPNDVLEEVLRIAFSSRRKMIKNNFR